MKKLDINVHHLTRVEGHGNIVVNYEKGVIENFKLEIVESPRFFEVMLKGRHISEAPHIPPESVVYVPLDILQPL